jgi:vacuolar-type H+-ATPase catalytic subunit A/Vma1
LKTASISEIKQELNTLPQAELLELCLRVIKFKKENKELIGYLLFEAHDLDEYIKNVKKQIDEYFLEVNFSNVYFAKKSFRKILRVTNKFIKYTTNKETEVELLIYYCSKIKSSPIDIKKSAALTNLYNNQLKKIRGGIDILHEDLQHDYNKEIDKLV